jgi:hypothetical protein
MTKFDVDRCIELLKERILPDVDSIKQLCLRVREILSEESNVLEVPSPVTIVGDIHGQVSLFLCLLIEEKGLLREIQRKLRNLELVLEVGI